MPINIWILGVAVLLLTAAACAPEPDWPPSPACVSPSCEAPGASCLASTPHLSLRVDQAVFDAEPTLPSVALVPWVLSKGDGRCVEDQGCDEKERCLEGRCWRAPVSEAALRRWRSGQGPLPRSLPGWYAQLDPGQGLLLHSTLGSEAGGIWGIYLGPRWVNSSGQALNVGPRPATLISVRGHGAGRWSEQAPKLGAQGTRLVLPLPKGWTRHRAYRWSLSCGPGLGLALSPLPSCQGSTRCVAFALASPLGLSGRSCRLLVKIPGQAALPTGWIRPEQEPVPPKVLPGAGLVYGEGAW